MNSDDVVREWAERSGEYSPDYYAYYGPNETSDLVRARLDSVVGTDAAVLELGCSSGRHLAHLREHGFRDLHGVDVNDDAFDVMADAYPDLFDAGTFHAATIEEAVREFADGRFDAVFSVEALQHVPPDREHVLDEVARVADDLLVTAEIESGAGGSADGEGDEGDDSDARGDPDHCNAPDSCDGSDAREHPDVNFVDDELPLYYRNWNQVFDQRGFDQVDVRQAGRDTLRVFRQA